MQIKDRLNPIGLGMNLVTRFAQSRVPDQLNIRKQSEQWLETLSRETVKLMQDGLPFGNKAGSTAQAPQIHTAGETTTLLDFGINADQRMIQESLDDFALQILRPAASNANEQASVPAEVLQMADEMGLASFVVPEDLGGTATSRSPITSGIIIHSLARGDMGLALAILCPMSFANVINQWGTPQQRATYLPLFLASADSTASPMATLALNEPTVDFNPHKPSCNAKKTATGWELNGVKCLVPMAARSRYLIVSAITNHGPRLFVVDSSLKGLSITATPAMGLKAAELATVSLKNVAVPACECIGDSAFDFGVFTQMCQAAWCALTVGTAQAVLDYVIPYCNDRVAFGEPISNRQAVAFMIANIGIELESMRVLTDQAISLLESGKDAKRATFLAVQQCSQRSMEIGTNGVQLLGGHGFTKEHPVERWYRDLRASTFLINGLHV